eukprot:TRINITY_DN8317_c0_g1_i9.p1 TRINITY_DN8317_c0_g1~~TRINITY_DN8317_c0_g1_i9.p1  ORF type:complete len:631 (+),score=166.10 TRINITY_DN8317_c0_g1_i9:1004-2896(+)
MESRDNCQSSETSEEPLTNVQMSFMGPFLEEHNRSIYEHFENLHKVFPSKDGVVEYSDATFISLLFHFRKLANALEDGVDYIEELLRSQLVAAIGKEISPRDFSDYLQFHERKIFRPQFGPIPFSYSVRRKNFFPEGILSIETSDLDSENFRPVTCATHLENETKLVQFSINSHTKIRVETNRYIHGFISHRFSQSPHSHPDPNPPYFRLTARAHQFSIFILLLGRILEGNSFDPKFGMILRNKDEIGIPLFLETIPTRKQFSDAIKSLSPEQRKFTEAFRSMQMENTLFGVFVIQVKPQLEKILNIPEGSLTKEIKLTQDLIHLFLDYHIPSDMFQFDGDIGISTGEKILAVKNSVDHVLAIVEGMKKKEYDEGIRRKKFYGSFEVEELQEVVFMEAQTSAAPAPEPPLSPLPVSDRITRKTGTLFKSSPEKKNNVQQRQPVTVTDRPNGNQQLTKKYEGLYNRQLPESDSEITELPKFLEEKYSRLDERGEGQGTIHSTIIQIGEKWERKTYPSLLLGNQNSNFGISEEKNTNFGILEQKLETTRALDLMNFITKSGSVVVRDASLHVIVAVQNSFDKTLMNTIIQDNVNPIEKLEHSSLIMASTIHRVPISFLTKPEHPIHEDLRMK